LPDAFAQALDGALIVAVGFATIVTFCVAADVQPPLVTDTLSVVVPDAPAVKVIALVFVALVIAPFVIDHA
jgi:hypothetical protein